MNLREFEKETVNTIGKLLDQMASELKYLTHFSPVSHFYTP